MMVEIENYYREGDGKIGYLQSCAPKSNGSR